MAFEVLCFYNGAMYQKPKTYVGSVYDGPMSPNLVQFGWPIRRNLPLKYAQISAEPSITEAQSEAQSCNKHFQYLGEGTADWLSQWVSM